MNDTCQYMYKVAEQFYKNGLINTELLFKNIHEEKADHFQIPVAAVNLAFCAELALKAISLLENLLIIRTHSLSDLFGQLPLTCQISIYERFEQIPLQAQFKIIRIRKAEIEDNIKHLPNESLPANKVLNILKIHEKAFELWRYSFEMAMNNVPALHFDFSSMVRLDQALLSHLNSFDQPAG